MNKGLDLWKKAKRIIPGGSQLLSKRSEMFLPDQWPSYYSRAKGIDVWDLDGKKYQDMSIMSVGACILGYADDDVNEAVIRAVKDGSICTLNCPEEVELAEKLLKLNPWAGGVRYARTAGEALSIAVRIARAHTKKDKVAFCYDDKTEILTQDGFRKFEELKGDELVATLNADTGCLEYRPILEKIKERYDGKLIHFGGQRLDLLVTPNHRIYRAFKSRNGSKHYELVRADSTLKRRTNTQMTSGCNWKGDKLETIAIPKVQNKNRKTKGVTLFPVKEFVRFMGWYLSEGCRIKRKRASYEISISQDEKNIEKVREIISIIKNLGFRPYINGHHIVFSSKELAHYLTQFGKCKEKHVPKWLKMLPKEELALFVDAMIKGDGCFEKGQWAKFYSSSKRLIDDMQEILLKLGYACNFFEVKGVGFSKNSKVYHLRISKEQIFGGYPKKEDYHGYVYCVTVRNHIILVRRNGKMVWSGNCGYHGWHDWYISANLADEKGLDGHLLPGLKPLGVPRGLKGTSIPFEYNKAEQLEAILEKNKGEVGAIVMEPMLHHFPKDGFLQKVRKIADDNNLVLVVDEVTVGWRKNVGGMNALLGLRPDIAVYGKAMSNGYPMAAIVGRREVMDAAQESFISSTYWTERIGPAAALATIAKLEREKVPAHLVKIGRMIGEGWKRIATEKDLAVDVLLDFEPLVAFDLKYGDKSQALATLFTQEMLGRGYLAAKKGVYVSNSHKEEDVRRYLEQVEEVFGIMKKAVDEGSVEKRLKGPIAHTGFKRLTS